MLRATASTGRKNGLASFIFFSERIVDRLKRNWAFDNVEGQGVGGAGVVVGGGVPALDATDAGGGVADFY